MKIVVLIGLTASGKTTIGRLLAKFLCCNFIDLDVRISEQVFMSVRAFYEKYGKKTFQEVEEKVLKDCLEIGDACATPLVISTGGGLIENSNALFILQKNPNAQIFFLYSKPKILFNRLLKKSKKEHSLPAFLKAPSLKESCSQIKYAKMKFLLICNERLKLLKRIECVKVKTKGLNAKKVMRMIKKML